MYIMRVMDATKAAEAALKANVQIELNHMKDKVAQAECRRDKAKYASVREGVTTVIGGVAAVSAVVIGNGPLAAVGGLLTGYAFRLTCGDVKEYRAASRDFDSFTSIVKGYESEMK